MKDAGIFFTEKNRDFFGVAKKELMYFPEYNLHPFFFHKKIQTKVNKLPAPPYNPHPHSLISTTYYHHIELLKHHKTIYLRECKHYKL